jgi:DNA-binding LacI/PurR family transcriptional regulator
MLEKSPVKIIADIEGKLMPFAKLQKLLEGRNTVFSHRFEWLGQKPANAVLTDWVWITEQTLQYFRKQGHRKMLFLSHNHELPNFKKRELQEAGGRLGMELGSPEFQYCGRFDFENNPERLVKIFKNDPPTAIFSRSDSIMFEFSAKIAAYFPETAGIEKIGAYDSQWSQYPGSAFASWRWDWREFWHRVFAHRQKSVEHYQPELILR